MSPATALLLVDVQNDYLAHAGLYPDRSSLIAAVGRLLALARARGWPVFHVQTRASPDGSNWMPHWHAQGRGLCIEGSAGAESPPEARPAPGETVLAKSHYSAFQNPELAPLLERSGVERLVVAGVHSHACIRASVTDAYAHGLNVVLPIEAIGSYDPEHGALALEWLDGRAARCLSLSQLEGEGAAGPERLVRAPLWQHRNPSDQSEVLFETPLMDRGEVFAAADLLAPKSLGWAAIPIAERAQRLRSWRDRLAADREGWIDALVRDVGKPRRDAEGELAYAFALLDHICDTLSDGEAEGGREIRYRPHGMVGLVTPWNNPFAIPISKIAPALGFGNVALWKPALPAAALSERLMRSLADADLGECVSLVSGDAAAGQAVVQAPGVGAISFTGSIAAGRQIIQRCGRLTRPLQAELGGNNAAIVLAADDIAPVARDLAGAMFSFAGQRCTAIRRVIVESGQFDAFAGALAAAVEDLRIGDPSDAATQVGPVISAGVRSRLLDRIGEALAAGARLVTGGDMPAHCAEAGCWLNPTVLTGLADDSPLLREEMFGPVVALTAARDLDDALDQHNRFEQGLLGAIYTQDEASQARFLDRAEAGLLLVNQARPAFSAAGPFVGWKASGYGLPEHGRWNRDVYTRVQAVYRRNGPV